MHRILTRLISALLILATAVSLTACNSEKAFDKKTNSSTTPSSTEDGDISSSRRSPVAIIGEHELSVAELNYFYIDAIRDYLNQYSQYIIDTTQPLNSVSNTDSNGVSWADRFLDIAINNIKRTYQLYDLAMTQDFKLSSELEADIDATMSTLDLYAAYYGYKNTDAYLRAVYGSGVSAESYRAYYEICTIATAYYTAYADTLEYDDSDVREYEMNRTEYYNSYSYSYYYFNCRSFLSDGTKKDAGNAQYSDAEKKAAAQTAKDLADQLASGKYGDRDSFDNAIHSLLSNHFDTYTELNDSGLALTSTKIDNVPYNEISSQYSEWLGSAARRKGDMVVIANKSTSDDTVNGYFVIRFDSVNDNTFYMKNVRHLLIAYTGGTTDGNGYTTYSSAEKQAAEQKAWELLQLFEQNGTTEAVFAQMATKHSDDTGNTNGGLYENIYPGQMVVTFEAWCYDTERKPGDYGLVQTEYGWHLMYFVGESAITYRDYMIRNDLRAEELAQWVDKLLASADLDLITTEYVAMDLVLNPASDAN